MLRTAAVDGTSLTLTYSETIDDAAGNLPATSAFAVTVNGASNSVTNVAVSGITVTLTLATAVELGQTVVMSYTDAVGDTSATIQDAAGNDAASFVNLTVTNATVDGSVDVPSLDPIASDNLINKVEHDGVTWFTGSAEANAKITITFNNGSSDVSVRNVRADEFGNWFLPYSSVSLPVDGTYTVSVTATDLAGNVSAAYDRAGVIIDSVIPTGLAIGAVATDDTVDAVENGSGFTISGTGEAGATVAISFSGSGHSLTTDADADGDANSNTVTVSESRTWSFTVAAKEAGDNFGEGEEIITVTQTDSAGNISAAVSKLINVSSTLVASGDLSTLGNLSAVTKLILNGDVTNTPTSPQTCRRLLMQTGTTSRQTPALM